MKINTLLGIAGPPGSGKTTFANALAKHLGIPCAGFGNFIRSLAGEADLQNVGQHLVETLPAETFVLKFLQFHGFEGGQSCVVEGVRHVRIWRTLQSFSTRAVLVMLDPPVSIVTERLLMRELSGERLKRRRGDHPVESELYDLKAIADQIIQVPEPVTMFDAIVKQSGLEPHLIS